MSEFYLLSFVSYFLFSGILYSYCGVATLKHSKHVLTNCFKNVGGFFHCKFRKKILFVSVFFHKHPELVLILVVNY